MSDFAKILLRERKEHGYTTLELGNKIGVSDSAITFWEKGLKKPSVESLQRLADLFGCSTDYLLGREAK